LKTWVLALLVLLDHICKGLAPLILVIVRYVKMALFPLMEIQTVQNVYLSISHLLIIPQINTALFALVKRRTIELEPSDVLHVLGKNIP